MKTKLFNFIFFFAVLSALQSCDKDEDIIFPEYPKEKLQFNQAKFIEISVSNSPADTSISFEVPSEKVLKIESAHLSERDYSLHLFLNNTLLVSVSGHTYTGTPSSFPIWLPEGTYSLRLQVTAPGGAQGNISGVEYNIVP